MCTLCPIGTYCPNQGTTDSDLKVQLCPKGTYCYQTHTYTDEDSMMITGAEGGLSVHPNKKAAADGGHACPLYKYCPKGAVTPLDIPRGTM